MSEERKRRWRLALGRYAEKSLGGLQGLDLRRDGALDYLYGREYQRRGLKGGQGGGSLDPTQMRAVDWLGEARRLFPKSVFDQLQSDALKRYNISELLNDTATLAEIEPSPDLLKVLLTFHGRAKPEVKDKLREVAASVIADLVARLKTEILRAFSGRRDRFRRSPNRSAANFDWRGTLRRNLDHYDPATQRLLADDLRFFSRQRRRLPWDIIMCVDQSGSMTDSVIHSAVMAAILSGLPGVTVAMVLFDTSVVDVTGKLTDPLETLLSVQLGGGTDIGKAVAYCAKYVRAPERTIFCLISDFAEGSSPRLLYQVVAQMAEARVKMIGLSALDDVGSDWVDHHVAERLAGLGMKIAAMTPDQLARWLAGIMR
jgi:Mg-chelatase subunit ChlD